MRKACVAIGILILFSLVAIGTFGALTYFAPKPLEMMDVEICSAQTPICSRPDKDHPTIVSHDPDGLLRVVIYAKAIRREACETYHYRTFSRAFNNEVVFQIMRLGGAAPINPKEPISFPSLYTLPGDKFPPDEYVFHALAITRCADGRTNTTTSSPTYFTVR